MKGLVWRGDELVLGDQVVGVVECSPMGIWTGRACLPGCTRTWPRDHRGVLVGAVQDYVEGWLDALRMAEPPAVAVGTCDVCGHAQVEYVPPRRAGLVCEGCAP